MFLALKLHFTSKYDYFKYHGKTRADLQGVQYRRDKWSYVKIGKRYDKELQDFIVANMVCEYPITWVRNLTGPEAEKNFVEWKKRKESISYIVSEECDTLVDFLDEKSLKFKDLFKVKGGQHPLLLRLHFQKYVSIETLLILASLLGFMSKWDREIDDDVIWPEVSNKLRKYGPFVTIDKSKLKNIIKEKFQ